MEKRLSLARYQETRWSGRHLCENDHIGLGLDQDWNKKLLAKTCVGALIATCWWASPRVKGIVFHGSKFHYFNWRHL